MEFRTIGVIGLGLTGRGIAACLLGNGHRVIGYSRTQKTRDAAREHIAGAIDELIDRGGADAGLRHGWQERYEETGALDAVVSRRGRSVFATNRWNRPVCQSTQRPRHVRFPGDRDSSSPRSA